MHEAVGILHIYSYQVRFAVVRQCAEFASMIFSFPDHSTVHTDKKYYKLFLIYKDMNADRIRCKVIYDWRPPHIWLNICAFLHILGNPSSYMTLHPIPSEFPYIWGKFSFLFIRAASYIISCYWTNAFLFIKSTTYSTIFLMPHKIACWCNVL
jgi:hypothetical protein